MHFYPRVTVPMPAAESSSIDGRMTFGVSGLDEMLGGGLPPTSATLIEGGTGTGKTLLGLHFLTTGAVQGKPGSISRLKNRRASCGPSPATSVCPSRNMRNEVFCACNMRRPSNYLRTDFFAGRARR